MLTVNKITREDSTANLHLISRHVWHLVGKYGEQLFMPDILKMKKENPSLNETQIKKAFRLTPHDSGGQQSLGLWIWEKATVG